ncbi:hypothetical protein Tco_0739331 [Tanacetum coccineum]
MSEFKTKKPEGSSSNWKPLHSERDATTSNLLEDDVSDDDSIFIVDPGWDDYCLKALKLNRPEMKDAHRTRMTRTSPVEMDDDTLMIEDSDVCDLAENVPLVLQLVIAKRIQFLVLAAERHRVLDEDDDKRYDESDFVSSDGSNLYGSLFYHMNLGGLGTRSRKRAETTSSALYSASSGRQTTCMTKSSHLCATTTDSALTSLVHIFLICITINPLGLARNWVQAFPSLFDFSWERTVEVVVIEILLIETIFGLNINEGAGDDDSEGGGVGILHPNLTFVSSCTSGFATDVWCMVGWHTSLISNGVRFVVSSQQSVKEGFLGLKADREQGKHVEALTQLCDKLSLGTGHFVPVLVGLLNLERNFDVMLLAERALSHLCVCFYLLLQTCAI